MSDLLETVFFQNVLIASRDAAILALIVALVLLITGKRIPPVWRHGLLLLIALRLLIPVLPSSSFSWQQWIPTTAETQTVPPPTAPPQVLQQQQKTNEVLDQTLLPPAPNPVASMTAPSLPVLSWKQTLTLIWLSGIGLILSVTFFQCFRFGKRVRQLVVSNDAGKKRITGLVKGLVEEENLRRCPEIVITDAVSSPALTGLFRPKILLPPKLAAVLSDTEISFVLRHELAHMQRHDVWTNWLLAILQAVHWFNPMIWWAFRRTRIEAERATDARVMQAIGQEQVTSYGETLIRLLEQTSAKTKSPIPGVIGVAESRRDLKKRISLIASFTGKRRRLAMLGAFGLFVMIAAVGLTQAPKEEKERASTAKTPEKKNRPILSNFGFPYPANMHGWTDEMGRFSIWINGDWKLELPDGNEIPIRYKFAGKQNRVVNGLMGGEWFIPLLESTATKTNEKTIRVMTLGGRSMYLKIDPKDKNSFRTNNRLWSGKAKEGDILDVEGPGDWSYHYEGGRLQMLITPSGKKLTWNFNDKGRLQNISWEDGTHLLTTTIRKDGLIQEINTIAGLRFRFSYEPYPKAEGEGDKTAPSEHPLYASRIIAWLPGEELNRHFRFKVTEDPKLNDVLRMKYSRLEPEKEPFKEDFSWQIADGVLLSDSESTYTKVDMTDDHPRRLTRTFHDGTETIYGWSNRKSLMYRKRRNGSETETYWVQKRGPSYFKVKKTVQTDAAGKKIEVIYGFDDLGRVIWMTQNGIMSSCYEYSESNGEQILKRFFRRVRGGRKKLANPLLLDRIVYRSLEDGRILRIVKDGIIEKYDLQGNITKEATDKSFSSEIPTSKPICDKINRYKGLSIARVLTKGDKNAILMDFYSQKEEQAIYVDSHSIISQSDVSGAEVIDGDPVSINFTIKKTSQKRLKEATKKMKGQKMAVIVDGKLISAPVVAGPFSKSVQVTGNFSSAWAEYVVEKVSK